MTVTIRTTRSHTAIRRDSRIRTPAATGTVGKNR